MASTRPQTIEIEIGKSYPFYCEVQEEYRPAEERINRFTGTMVEVLRRDNERDTESGEGYIVKTWNNDQFSVHAEEINGWDYALDQFFWLDQTRGKNHDRSFIVA